MNYKKSTSSLTDWCPGKSSVFLLLRHCNRSKRIHHNCRPCEVFVTPCVLYCRAELGLASYDSKLRKYFKNLLAEFGKICFIPISVMAKSRQDFAEPYYTAQSAENIVGWNDTACQPLLHLCRVPYHPYGHALCLNLRGTSVGGPPCLSSMELLNSCKD